MNALPGVMGCQPGQSDPITFVEVDAAGTEAIDHVDHPVRG